MPLTDGAKPKVSLASLSGTTAAAAESLWAKSKASRKKKPVTSPESLKVTPEEEQDCTPHVSSHQSQSQSTTTAPPNSQQASAVTTSNSNNSKIHLQQQALHDRHEFRRKFLEGLQFYCENSSLILNSDLPADLIEFVTSHGFSIESLGIILELKKSSSAFSALVDKKPSSNSRTNSNRVGGVSEQQQAQEQNFSEISRRLLQHWMSADSCAEAFVSLSLGEEIPGLIAESSKFQRLLFSVPDNFHLSGKDFVQFLLGQILLAFYTLTHAIKTEGSNSEDEVVPLQVRTQILATFLDRVFMRYFSDSEHFYEFLNIDGEISFEDYNCDSFQTFITELANLCKCEVIAKRLVSKALQHLSSHSSLKLAKAIFIHKDEATASLLLYPAYAFLESNGQWKFILQNLPVKTVTKSKRFWLNWAKYIEKESRCFMEFWKISVEHWMILNKSQLIDEHSLYSATLAVVALARQIKCNQISNQDGLPNVSTLALSELEFGKIIQNITNSLESINENKRAAGMALGQVVSDIHTSILEQNKSSGVTNDLKRLDFESTSALIQEIMAFYENGITLQTELMKFEENVNQKEKSSSRKIKVLDSDDDAEEETEENVEADDDFPILGEELKVDSEVGIDPRIMTLRARNQKIPMYFSEILEALLESSKNEDEAEILRYIVVLKIPVLLFMGVRIDAKIATSICRCLVDMEDASSLKIPILLALYELFVQHPFEISDAIGSAVFDRNSYALGQRQANLTRLTHIVRLSSKQFCFNCYIVPLKKSEKELLGIYPEFFNKYFEGRKKLRFCQDCKTVYSDVLSGDGDKYPTDVDKRDETSLTWKEIVDRRVAAKTRYFFTRKSKTLITVPDEYSSKLLPILWATIANRLTSATPFYLSKEERLKSGKLHDVFLVHIFQYLVSCVLGAGGPSSPHMRNIASHAGELVTNFVQHEDAVVRRAVLSLLGVTLSVGDGKAFVMEALSSQGNIAQLMNSLLDIENDSENRKLIRDIEEFVAGSTVTSLLEDFNRKGDDPNKCLLLEN